MVLGVAFLGLFGDIWVTILEVLEGLGGLLGRTPPNYLLGRFWPALLWTHPPGRPYGDIKRSTRTNAQSKIIIFCFETIWGVLQTPFGEPNYGDLAFRTAKRPSKVHQSEYWKNESVKLS